MNYLETFKVWCETNNVQTDATLTALDIADFLGIDRRSVNRYFKSCGLVRCTPENRRPVRCTQGELIRWCLIFDPLRIYVNNTNFRRINPPALGGVK